MTLYDIYDRAYDHASRQRRLLEEVGLPLMHERDHSDDWFAARCQSLLLTAAPGDDTWNEIMYLAASAELARHEREVVQVTSGDAA